MYNKRFWLAPLVLSVVAGVVGWSVVCAIEPSTSAGEVTQSTGSGGEAPARQDVKPMGPGIPVRVYVTPDPVAPAGQLFVVVEMSNSPLHDEQVNLRYDNKEDHERLEGDYSGVIVKRGSKFSEAMEMTLTNGPRIEVKAYTTNVQKPAKTYIDVEAK